MVSLVDLVATPKRVELRGAVLEVYGVDAANIVRLMQAAPELKRLMVGKELTKDLMGNLLKAGPEVVGIIIAAGLRKGDDPKEVAAASTLAIGEQALLLEAVMESTFPQGLAVFLERAADFLEKVAPGVVAHIKEAGTKSQEPLATSPGEAT